jgi:hypothetical protein
MSILFAGGGVEGGQVVGATNRLGEHPIGRRFGPHDFIATIFQHLGIEAARVQIRDATGRPIPLIPDGAPIAELTAKSTRNGRR